MSLQSWALGSSTRHAGNSVPGGKETRGIGRSGKDVKVASMIAEIRAKAGDTAILAVERTRAELARVCFSDVRKLCNPDGSLKKVHELDDDTAAAVASFEIDEIEVAGKVVGRTIKIKFWDKNRALEMAVRHLGLCARDNTQRSENLSLQVLLVGAPTNERA